MKLRDYNFSFWRLPFMEIIEWKSNYSTKSNKTAQSYQQIQTAIPSNILHLRGWREKKKTSLDLFEYKNILYYIEFYKIPLLNTSSQTAAKWEDYCWNRQGICGLLPIPWWTSGSHSGTRTDLFSTEDAAFQRREGSGMRTLVLINPLPLLEGSLPNSPPKETLKWSDPWSIK